MRAFLPDATGAWVVDGDRGEKETPMEVVHPRGFFEVVFPDRHEVFPYRLKKP